MSKIEGGFSKIAFINILDETPEYKVIENCDTLSKLINEYAKSCTDEVYSHIMDQKVSIYLNGELIPVDDWHKTQPCDDDEFIIVPDINGGAAKTIFGALLVVFSFIPGPWSFAAFYMRAIGISMMLGGVSELLFTPDLPTFGNKNSNSTTTYNWTGIRTTARSDLAIPVVYGTHKVGGNIISLFTRASGKTSYLYMLLALCEGEIDGICKEKDIASVCSTSDTTDEAYADPFIELDEQPMSMYSDVE